jgi:hypothetical protein
VECLKRRVAGRGVREATECERVSGSDGIGIPLVNKSIRAGVAGILAFDRHNIALAAMQLRHDADAVGFFNAAGLKVGMSIKEEYIPAPRRTFLVVIHARAPAFQRVLRKLRAWQTPRVVQARKVHSSLPSQSSYLIKYAYARTG